MGAALMINYTKGGTSVIGAGILLLATFGGSLARAQDAAAPQPTHVADSGNTVPAPWTLVRDLAGDAEKVPSRTTLLVLGISGALALTAHPSDDEAVRSLSANHIAEETLDAGATAGSVYAQVGGAATLYGVGALVGKPAAARLGGELLEAQALSGLITEGTKQSVRRRRPDGGANSFPSGHTSSSFATAEIINETFGFRYGALAYLAGAYIGASRIADRRHFTSDVLFGAGVGIASAHAVELSRRHRLNVAAAPLPGGVGLVGSVRLGDHQPGRH